MVTISKELIALAWLLALAISPEGMALHGHLAGRYGWAFILPLAAALIVHGAHIAVVSREPQNDLRNNGLAAFSTSLLYFAALPAVAVCMATATLVSSGFVFNEVFVHWFPNFGFAAFLLMGLLMVNLAGRRIATGAQVLFTSTALLGLAWLTLAGAFVTRPQLLEATSMPRHFDFKGVGLAAVALLGYDLLRYTANDFDRRRARYTMIIVLVVGGAIIWAWSAVALTHVPASRLAETSIPHILVAKAIMGPTGRIVMGLVVIAGSLAAVNLLFRAVVRMVVDMVQSGAMPPMAGITSSRPWLPLSVLTGLTGLLMAKGFAGTDWLDIYLRAGLILWLVSLGLIHLTTLMTENRCSGWIFFRPAVHFVALATTTALGVILILTDHDPGRLARALLMLIAIAAGLASIGRFTARHWPANRHRKVSHFRKGVLE